MVWKFMEHLTAPAVSGLYGLAGSVPLIAAASESDAVPLPVWFVSILLGGILALVGWLLQRAVSKLDDQIEKISARVEELDKNHLELRERVLRMETKCAVFHAKE